MKKENKAKLKKVWDFQKKNLKEYKHVSKTEYGNIVLEYQLFIDQDNIELDPIDNTFKPIPKFKKFLDFCMIDDDDIFSNYIMSDNEDIVAQKDELQREYDILRRACDPDNEYNFDDLLCEYDTFEDAWAEYSENEREIRIPNVSSDYGATVYSNGVVKVGCQTVTIEKVQEILNAYNKLRS